jgi:CRP-like cAMP-binding protein
VFEEGEKRDALYVVLNGAVKVSVFDDNGKEYILDLIGEGGFFGEHSLFDEFGGFANVTTTKESQLLMIRRQDFLRLLMENPAFSVSILKSTLKRLRSADEKLRGLAFQNVEERILQYLRDLGDKVGVKVKDRIIIERGPTQIEIANSCGCSRETVSRMLKNLVKKGKISVMRKQYTIRPVYPPE